MRHEANKEIWEEITKIKEEIIDGLDQAEARLQEQIAEGNKQTMAALQRLRKHCLPPLSATVKQHGQSPPPRRQRPSAPLRLARARLAALGSSVRRGRGRSH